LYTDSINDLTSFLDPILTIIDMFSLEFIMKAETDLYRFFELIPLTSQDNTYLALKVISKIVLLFQYKFKD